MSRVSAALIGVIVVVVSVVAGGCAFFFGPVPCLDDDRCPYSQRCVVGFCTDDVGEGEGEGEGEEPDVELYDRFGEIEPNGRPIERCLGMVTAEIIFREPDSSGILGRNVAGDLADVECDAAIIACDAPADGTAIPPNCVADDDVVVCDEPAQLDEGPRARCARLVGTSTLLLSGARIAATLSAKAGLVSAAQEKFVLVDGEDEDGDGDFVRRDAKVIAPGPIGVFEVGQPGGEGEQDCLALDESGYHDANCADERDVICTDVLAAFDGPGCEAIGALAFRCPNLGFDDGVAFCEAQGGRIAEVTSRALYNAIRRSVVSPAWVGARRVDEGGGAAGFEWLGGQPLRLEEE